VFEIEIKSSAVRCKIKLGPNVLDNQRFITMPEKSAKFHSENRVSCSWRNSILKIQRWKAHKHIFKKIIGGMYF